MDTIAHDANRLENILADAQFPNPGITTDDVNDTMMALLDYDDDKVSRTYAAEPPVFETLIARHGAGCVERTLKQAIVRVEEGLRLVDEIVAPPADKAVRWYQISFIRDELRAFDFRGTQADADKIRADLEVKIGDDVMDLQVYTPNREPERVSSLIEALIDDTRGLQWLNTDDGKVAMARAVLLDAAAAASDTSYPATIEFVWENGGGDDNAFTSTVNLRPGHETELTTLIENAIGGSPISDISIYQEGETHFLSSQEAHQEALAAGGYEEDHHLEP